MITTNRVLTGRRDGCRYTRTYMTAVMYNAPVTSFSSMMTGDNLHVSQLCNPEQLSLAILHE